ncbi:MAG: hypothetical protein H7Y20_02310 [Bryobacteraceae bacterium]|nr:hypothetical protein [Bryobacteraceae bacterium]
MARDPRFPPMSTPELTYAVVAGISNYEMGPLWALPKAGEHAVQFAEWLRAREVPASNIRLFLSTSDHAGYSARLSVIGVSAISATTTTFNQVIENEVPAWTGETLYFFWAGHGNIDEQDQRILFFEDWRELQHQRHLDLTSLLKQLRRVPLGDKFPFQVAYVDACANQFETIGFEGRTGSRTVNLNPLVPGVHQVFFLAADSGDQAVAGEFSELVLDELTRASWPPDPDAIIAAVRPKFEDASQRPVRLAWRTAAGDEDGIESVVGDLPASAYVNAVEAIRGFPVRHLRSLARAASDIGFSDSAAREDLRQRLSTAPGIAAPNERARSGGGEKDLLHIIARAFDSQRENLLLQTIRSMQPESALFEAEFERTRLLRQVRQQLLALPLTMNDFREIYHTTIASLSLEASRVNARTFHEMLDELCVPGSGPEQFLSLFEFVLRAADRVPSHRANLEALIDVYASPALAQTVRDRLRRELRFQLRISVEPNRNVADAPESVEAQLYVSATALAVRSWREPAAQWDPDVETAIRSIVREAREVVGREYHLDTTTLDVELLVSWPFMLKAPDRIVLPGPKRTLGQLHPFVLRWRERLLTPWDVDKEPWSGAKKRYQPTRKQAGSVNWVQHGDYAGLDKHAGLAALNFCPKDDSGVDALFEVIGGGVPFVAWLRTDPATWPPFMADLAQLAAACNLEELPRALRKARFQTSPTEIADHLTLFWDDPESEFIWKRIDVK